VEATRGRPPRFSATSKISSPAALRFRGATPHRGASTEPTRKFGRTTGFTAGCVLSLYLDLRIRYDRTGQSAYFEDQILIEPTPPHTRYVAPGDSGSLALDGRRHAIGLIFAGTTDVPKPRAETDAAAPGPPRVEGCGVANPIAEVLDRLKVELVV
jgi:hypothetical protein